MENRSLHNVEFLQAFHNVEIMSLQYVEKVSEQVKGLGIDFDPSWNGKLKFLMYENVIFLKNNWD